MAVTKRTRFEVLRRDNYTCRYCRSTEAELTIDHVTPVALGGSDKPDNLVAACRDCNTGKSSAHPEAALVAEVSDEAIRHAERIKQAYAVLRQALKGQTEYIDQFADEFPGRKVPNGWKGSLIRWFEMGVPIELIIDAGHRAALRTRDGRKEDAWFRYMAGIIWSKCETATAEVTKRDLFDGAWMTEEDLTDLSHDAYMRGAAYEAEASEERVAKVRDAYAPFFYAHAFLSAAVDKCRRDVAGAEGHAQWAGRRDDLTSPLATRELTPSPF